MDFVKVAPSELEDLLRGHSGVLDVAVIGVPDEKVATKHYIVVCPKFGHSPVKLKSYFFWHGKNNCTHFFNGLSVLKLFLGGDFSFS